MRVDECSYLAILGDRSRTGIFSLDLLVASLWLLGDLLWLLLGFGAGESSFSVRRLGVNRSVFFVQLCFVCTTFLSAIIPSSLSSNSCLACTSCQE